jgi:hypothetical protein
LGDSSSSGALGNSKSSSSGNSSNSGAGISSSSSSFSGDFGSSSSEIKYYSSSSDYETSESSSSYGESIKSSSSGGTSAASSSSITSAASSSSLTPAKYEKLTSANATPGWTSRYWDGCKPSCSWPEKSQSLVPWTICRNCDVNDREIEAYISNPYWDEGTKSSCDQGGIAYTCWDMAPIKVNDTLSYAFAATPGSGDQCGKCFQLQFDGDWRDAEARVTHKALKGKTLIVMSSNIGHDVAGGQFDVLIPGGGVGAFDSFSKQLNVNIETLGARMGGLLTSCDDEIGGWTATLDQWQTCLRSKCQSVFGSKSKFLLDGCMWQADWFMAANNPTLLYKEVACPQYLLDKYKSGMHTEKPVR